MPKHDPEIGIDVFVHTLTRRFRRFYAEMNAEDPETFPDELPMSEWWEAFIEFAGELSEEYGLDGDDDDDDEDE